MKVFCRVLDCNEGFCLEGSDLVGTFFVGKDAISDNILDLKDLL